MKIRTFTQRDYIKANRRASRLAEIENHQRPVSIAGVHKSKKVYDRKRNKAEMKKALPGVRILADMKTVDTGAMEVEMAAKAGAEEAPAKKPAGKPAKKTAKKTAAKSAKKPAKKTRAAAAKTKAAKKAG